MVIAGCYARKSNDEPGKAEHEKSVVGQIEQARAFARKKGWRFDEASVFVDDAVTGRNFKTRPGLNKLRSVLPTPRFQVLIVREIERLGRPAENEEYRLMSLIGDIKDAGVEVWSVLDDAEVGLDGVKTFMGSHAAGRQATASSKTSRAAQRAKFLRGEYTGGQPRYGYRWTKPPAMRKEAREIDVVVRIFKIRAETGDGFSNIARELERRKIPSPSGKSHWTGQTIRNILNDEIYRGVVTWGRTAVVYTKGEGARRTKGTDVLRREVPKLRAVDEKLWLKVQAVNKAHADDSWRNAKGQLISRPVNSKAGTAYWLSRFLACGLCKGGLHGTRSGVDKKGQGVPYLACTTRKNKGPKACPNSRMLPMRVAEDEILDVFEEQLTGALVTHHVEELLEDKRRTEVDPRPLEREQAKLKAEVANLVDLVAKGKAFEEVHAGVAERKARLEHLDGLLKGATVVTKFDYKEFKASVEELLIDWKTRMRKNPSLAAQVLGKLLPKKLFVSPVPGSRTKWVFEGTVHWDKVVEEVEPGLFQTLKVMMSEVIPREAKSAKRPKNRGRIVSKQGRRA